MLNSQLSVSGSRSSRRRKAPAETSLLPIMSLHLYVSQSVTVHSALFHALQPHAIKEMFQIVNVEALLHTPFEHIKLKIGPSEIKLNIYKDLLPMRDVAMGSIEYTYKCGTMSVYF